LSTLDQFIKTQNQLVHGPTALIGGLRGKKIASKTSRAEFLYENDELILQLVVFLEEPDAVGLSQLHMLNTNKKTFTTQFEPGNVLTTLRVGSFDIQDLSSPLDDYLGKYLWQSYPSSTKTGFGQNAIVTKKMCLFSYYIVSYVSSITDPETKVQNVCGVIAGGQKYLSYAQTGRFYYHNFPPTLNETYDFYFTQKDTENIEQWQVSLKTTKITIVPEPTLEGTYILSEYDIEMLFQKNILRGKGYSTVFIAQQEKGIGRGVFQLFQYGCLFFSLLDEYENPFDPLSKGNVKYCITGGTGVFEPIINTDFRNTKTGQYHADFSTSPVLEFPLKTV
jgi:hypothetical protein